ncbi:MAG: biotin/lipoyl-containing protein, partial [Arsenophonus sp. ET-DL12-MAG3]
MSDIEILVPDLPESIVDATVAIWHKKPGDQIKRDEVLVEIETDKVILEVPATDSGILKSILEEEGATVLSKQLLGYIYLTDNLQIPVDVDIKDKNITELISDKHQTSNLDKGDHSKVLTPAVRRLITEHNLNPANMKGSG